MKTRGLNWDLEGMPQPGIDSFVLKGDKGRRHEKARSHRIGLKRNGNHDSQTQRRNLELE